MVAHDCVSMKILNVTMTISCACVYSSMIIVSQCDCLCANVAVCICKSVCLCVYGCDYVHKHEYLPATHSALRSQPHCCCCCLLSVCYGWNMEGNCGIDLVPGRTAHSHGTDSSSARRYDVGFPGVLWAVGQDEL